MGYRLNRHHKFEQGECKYVADLETNDIIEINDIEWDILSRYETQTEYQIVEALKEKYKVTSVFEGIMRLEWLGKRGQLLTQIPESVGELDTFPTYIQANSSYWFRLVLGKTRHPLTTLQI